MMTRVLRTSVICASLAVVAALLAACGDAADDTARSATDAVATIGVPTLMASPAPSGSLTPSLVNGANDAVLLSWTERLPDSTVAIHVAQYTNGSWDTTRTISEKRPYFVNWADFPAVTTLRDGALAAHWLEREGTGKYAYGIRVVRSSDAGKTWSAPMAPHTDNLPAEHGFVALWPEGADGLGLAWLDGRKSAMKDSSKEMTVRTAVVGATGTLSREAVLDARSCDCCQVVAAATRSGHVVVYRDRTSEEIRDIVAVRRTGDTWSAPAVVHADNWKYPGCPVNGPSIATRGDSVMVAWYTGANDTSRVYTALSTDGGATFGDAVRIDDGDPIGRVAMVFDGAGHAVVGWVERLSPDSAELRVRRVVGVQRSAATTVSAVSTARQSGFPKMVVVRDTLVVAWTAVKPALQVRMAQLSLTSANK